MKCINAVLALPDAQQDRLLERIERLMRMGYAQAGARRSAAQALYDEALAETAEMEQLIREQHPDLFLGATRRAADITETPEFKRWFGDSKVVDAEGKPLVVYHGTASDFTKFGIGRGAIYFTDDKDAASSYAFVVDATDSQGNYVDPQPNVMPVYLSIRNPKVLDRAWFDANVMADGEADWGHVDEAAYKAQDQGHDGLILRSFPDYAGVVDGKRVEREYDQFVAFRPEQIKSAIGNNGNFDPANPDIRYSSDDAREILGRVVDAKNKSLRRVNPASVLERDIATATKAIDMVLPQISAGKEMRAEIPVGPTPHVLHMLGAPMQTMVTHTNIIRKVMSDKHSEDFANISSREFVEAIYKPAMVLRGAKPGEWEILTGLKNAKGQPIMVALMQDSVLPPLPGGRSVKAMSVKSAYARTLIGAGDTILSRVKAGRLAYAEMDKAQSAVGNGWAQFQASIADGLRSRTVKDDLALVKFIGDNFKPDSSPAGWSDAPSFSRDGQFELPEFTNMRKVQQNMQDRYNRWKQAVDAVREQGGAISEANDFYTAEERYWGRVGTQVEDFGEEITAFAEAVQKDGLTLQDVAEYVYAKHAKERNAYVARMRDDMEGTGSGMTDEEADAILESARQAGLEAELEKHADTLYRWIDGTRKVLLDNGLISQEEADSWEGMFENYVPLRGLEGKTQPKGTGGGFRITGKESKQITGRRSQAKQIIEQIIQDRTRALIRAGKNEVLRSFLNFVLDNPSPNLWKVDAVESKPTVVVDEFGNRSVEIRDKAVTDARTVQLKDGGRTIYIEIKDDTLREQMQNLHLDSVSAPFAALLAANRFVGSMLTAYNPAFVMTNAIRDAQTALFGMAEIKGLKGALNLAAQYPRALRESLSAHFGTASPQYREYLLAGGTTGYFGLKDLDQVSKDLQGLVKDAERSALNPIRVGKAIARFVESANGVIEQTTRFAAYLAAREAGDSVAQASKISKNITVNFNRKGAWGNQLSAAILFYNPAVQGSARLMQALRSPKVLGLLGGMASAMFFLALANSQIGGEDEDGAAFWDKVPKETRERNIVFMLPPKRNEQGSLEARFIKIPMAYGYNAFGVAAYEMADQWRRMGDPVRAREPVESALRISQAFIGAVTPAQAIGQALDTPSSLVMLPYSNALGPIAQALANQSGFGRPLYPDNPNERQMPDSQKYSVGQAGTVFQKGAELLNTATGGSKYESGLVDITPGALENAARFYGGGLTSMALDVMNTLYVKQHIERPEPDLRKLPLARNFYGVVDEQSDRWLAYERMKKAEAKIQPLDAAIRNGDGEAIDKMLDDSDLAAAGKALDRTRQQLSKLRKAELQIMQDDTLTDAQKYVRLMEVSYETRKVLQNWNGLYDDLLRETSTRRDK